MAPPIRIGISSCLLGERVRYDGGHKRDPFLVETLGRFIEWVPVCPELELGLGVPREPIHLVRRSDEVRLIGVESGVDHTVAMRKYAKRRLDRLEAMDLCGYVFKKDSPSCGLWRVAVWNSTGTTRQRNGRGLFAAALVERFRNLPVEEEGRLSDARLRDNFIERVFAYARLKALFSGRWRVADLVAFHTAHKLQLLAHSPGAYRSLGRLVAAASSADRRELRERYESGFMAAIAKKKREGRRVKGEGS